MVDTINVMVPGSDSKGRVIANSDEREAYIAKHQLFDVSELGQLIFVPQKFVSYDLSRPLKDVDPKGNEYTYLLKPMFFSVMLVLVVMGMERFAFYGVTVSMFKYVSGEYTPDWNAGMSSTEGASYVQVGTALAFAFPFIGAIFADGILGIHRSIIVFGTLFYLPGVVLIALTAQAHLFTIAFPTDTLTIGYLFLFAIGAGVLKPCLTVFGANQHHGILQRVQLESYFVYIYMATNVGVFCAISTIPVLCAHGNAEIAYFIVAGVLALGLFIFVCSSAKSVKMKSLGSVVVTTIGASYNALRYCPPSLEKTKVENGGKYESGFVNQVKIIGGLIILATFTIPFSLCYSQMTNTIQMQGAVMKTELGFIDAAWISNFDAFSAIVSGALITFGLYPVLYRYDWHPGIMTKFGLGTLMGALAMFWFLCLDLWIHSHYTNTKQKLSILYQLPGLVLIGIGEIFTFCSAFECAYLVSPAGFKVFGFAMVEIVSGSIGPLLSTLLVNICKGFFFKDNNGGEDLQTIEAYTQAHVYNFFAVILSVSFAGALLCFSAPARRTFTYIQQLGGKFDDFVIVKQFA